jgi:quercetin dioxygenase-like cupin family protein
VNRAPFIVTPEAYPTKLDVLGIGITVLADRARTGGYEITLQQGPEGVGPPPHRHAWDESFFVLDGNVEITADGRTRSCRPGTLVHVPAGTMHGFRFGAGGGRMFELSQGANDTVAATRMFSNVAQGLPADLREPARVQQLLADNGVLLAEA